MNDINTVLITGNVAQDAKKISGSFGDMLKFSIAINNAYKTKQGEKKNNVCFIDVVVFWKNIDYIFPKLTKGTKILVEGSLSMQKWKDKETGYNRVSHNIVATNIQLLHFKDENSTDSSVEPIEMNEVAINADEGFDTLI